MKCTNISFEIPYTGTDLIVNSIALTETNFALNISSGKPIIGTKQLIMTIQDCPLGFQLSNATTRKSCNCLGNLIRAHPDLVWHAVVSQASVNEYGM